MLLPADWSQYFANNDHVALALRQFATSRGGDFADIVMLSDSVVFGLQLWYIRSDSHFATGAAAPVFFYWAQENLSHHQRTISTERFGSALFLQYSGKLAD